MLPVVRLLSKCGDEIFVPVWGYRLDTTVVPASNALGEIHHHHLRPKTPDYETVDFLLVDNNSILTFPGPYEIVLKSHSTIRRIIHGVRLANRFTVKFPSRIITRFMITNGFTINASFLNSYPCHDVCEFSMHVH